ncbi:Per1-like protein [Daedalea quercina L-15889]|uniref:Post-GPI attachment to proteins factor 3 n=1 Tax=Daedalea quercina L-15889 TaxID=1314783 RepID=A0A165TVT9_9APHY|nr:Per1-like protein [Daedalea quercina L-15889]
MRIRHLIVFSSIPVLIYASAGDRADNYQNCVSKCASRVCGDNHNTWASTISLPMWLTRWTCIDDCKYGCMHAITDHALENAQPVLQYHGKWPFWRLAGMQEPASVAFSVLNFLVHYRSWQRIQKTVPDSHPMKSYYRRFALVSMNAWVWSSVFHTRDLPLTEKMDYFSAALAILYALYYTVVRLFHLYTADANGYDARRTQSIGYIAWTSLCTLAYLAHVSYLTFLPRFDYTYNMVFNLTIGMVHNLLWLAYSLPPALSLARRFPHRSRSYRPPYATAAALFVILTIFATAFELFDFPPWGRIIDAHSLWHLSTVPITLFWYRFLISDALDAGWKVEKS